MSKAPLHPHSQDRPAWIPCGTKECLGRLTLHRALPGVGDALHERIAKGIEESQRTMPTQQTLEYCAEGSGQGRGARQGNLAEPLT